MSRYVIPLLACAALAAVGQAQSSAGGPKSQLRLAIDAPGPGTGPVRGRATFSGWALDTGSLVSEVDLSIDGVLAGAATIGASRPDVCTTYVDVSGCPDVGWTFAFDASTVEAGKHSLLVTAKAASGNQTSVTRQFTTAAPMNGSAASVARRDDSTPPDFQLGINPSSLTINTGDTGIATVQVSAVGSFNGTVTFTCSLSGGLTGATCAIPGTVAASGSATLIINAPASIAQTRPERMRFVPLNGPPFARIAMLILLIAVLLWIAPRRRAPAISIAALALSFVLLTSCDEGSSSSSTPAPAAQPTSESGMAMVTASSGTLAHTVTASITINQSTAQNPVLNAQDVMTIIQNAADAINSPTAVFAVTDRLGNVLGVACMAPGACNSTATGNFGAQVPATELAVGLARTASFFSNSTAPLSSRTVRYISGIHFPPGVSDTSNAPLYGIENTNRGCLLDPSLPPGGKVSDGRSIDGKHNGLGIITGKADLFDSVATAVNPGGVPLYKSNILVGGIGVAGVPAPVAEYAAFAAETNPTNNYFLNPLTPPGYVVINGIQVPFVIQTSAPAGVQSGTASLMWSVPAIDSPGPDQEGYLLGPKAGPVGGLSQSDVDGIVQAAVAEGNLTRAVIRLPPGIRAKFVIAVGDLDGTLLALYRMPDATIFSIDVAVAKSRNAVYFSGPNRVPSDLPGVPIGTAVTNRTIGFGAQPFFPPGIDGTAPGPFFPLYINDVRNPCTQGSQPANANQNGIVFFPGSAPLYRNGVMVGGLGVSGDGVDQDDFDTNAGASNFPAPQNIRADQIIIDGIRLPYQNFPRDPTN